MQNPLPSFTIAFLIWLFFIATFSCSIFKRTEIPQLAIEIDATMLGETTKKKNIAPHLAKTKPIINKRSEATKDQQQNQQNDNSTQDYITKTTPNKTPILFNPLPQIPDDLREESFMSDALARFYINADGSVAKVELIKPCANPRLNHLLLKSLRKWKFATNSIDSTQDIRVHFKVE